MTFIIGVIIFAVGLSLIIKTEWYLSNFGRIDFFEQHLGLEGGSRLGYKLLGMLVIFIGLLAITGMIGGFLKWFFSPLTRYTNPHSANTSMQ